MSDTHSTIARGVRLAVDVGRARVGLAASDPDGIMAHPVKTLRRDLNGSGGDQRYVYSVARDREATVVYVGDPINLHGQSTASTADAEDYAQGLADTLAASVECAHVQVFLVDERLSTVLASQSLHQAGRSTRSQRSVIDQAAAVEILEHALTVEKRDGQRAGRRVVPTPEQSTEGQS
ncbi:Holliday junction resolvase RuvX [Auritidibacter ignavus]|uniref:Holliday junction resolvase RuvX n=1 Tax=Auritidibacter ignavus TaxID=678932 RepID=UPI00109D11C4|nr:Holliday junction resolvase RuvX [Auritidibacter ignavus]